MLSAFYAFFGEKLLLGQASESGRRMAGDLFENSAEAGWIGKTEGSGDFGHALGAGAEKVLGLRDSAAVKIVLIGQAHHLLKYSGKVGEGHSGLPCGGGEADIGSVVVVDKANCLLDLMVLAEGDGGRLRPRQLRRIGPGKDVLSARCLGYAEWILKVIAGAVPECLDRHLLIAACRDDDNENGGLNVLDLFHDIDAGHIGQPGLSVRTHPELFLLSYGL